MKSVLIVFALFAAANATSILWTGYVGDNQWTTQNNWYPNSVPGPNDDVTIDKGTVFVTIPTGVNSLVMGTNVDTPANLTFYHAFAVGNGGLQVKANGNLIVNSGLETVTGNNIAIDGTLTFYSGFISGVWALSSRGNGYFPGAGQRNIVAGSLTNNGNLYVSGVVGLNQSAQLINNNALYASDTTQFMVFDSSSASIKSSGSITFNGKILRFQAPAQIAAFTLSAGNVEIYNTVSFGATLTIPSGSKISSLGNAVTTFSTVQGQGQVIASGASTTFNTLNNINAVVAAGGNTFFTQGATATSVTLSGGNINFGGNVVASNLLIQGGILGGAGQISGSSVQLATAGVNVGTSVTVTGNGQVTAPSLLSFAKTGYFSVANGAVFTVSNNLNITGPQGPQAFMNNGTVVVGAGVTFQSQNINVVGSGSFAANGAVTTSTAYFAQGNVTLGSAGSFSGSNAAVKVDAVVSATNVRAVLGDYTLNCPVQCNKVTTPGSAQKFAFAATK